MDPNKRCYRARLRARLAAAFAAERGSVLIEVMVGAVVLSIAAVGLLNGLDGAQGTGAKNKARSVAAALAEQDQERMRSMPVATLAGYTETRTVTVSTVDYTVTSTATWAVDTGGPISCSNNSKTAANIRIVSEVSSPATRGIVDQASLVTPPPGTFATGEGRAVVKVLDRNAAPISGASVNLTGTASASGTTNSLGCAVFPFMPVGGYTASVSGLTLVDWQGNSPATKGTSVTEGTSTLTSFEMDSAADIRANFDTKVGTAIAVTAKSQWATVTNAKLTVGSKTFQASPAGSPNTLVTASPLFPFLDGYGVYAGQCSANNPALPPTSSASSLQVFSPTPGQILTMPTTKVRVPSINVGVVDAAGTPLNGAAVFVETADSGCANTFPTQTAATANGITGSLPEPGFPYGTYRICAQASVTGPHGHADFYAGGYDAKSTSTVATETPANRVDDLVSNTNPAGNTTSTTTNGAIRIRLNRNNACE
ncbi:MAG: type II secretion system protein [Thermoleophilaceae bacterium]|nr:type II secretion system protein [Thermoleophilaceae bacterium]